jgi:tRNA(Ile)-lysidine synthase
LPEPRARSLLRFHLGRRGVPIPESRELAEMLRQLLTARPDARLEFRFGVWRVRRYRGALWIESERATMPAATDVPWAGEPALELPSLGGTLRFEACTGDGLAARLLREGVRVRDRRGGERLRLHEGGPSRALKNLFQETGIPPWRRAGLPLVFCGDALAWVPGIGPAWDFRARPGEPAYRPVWMSS